MPRLLLIANPLASGFTGSTHRQVLASLSESYQVESIWPNGPDESKEASAKAAANGVDVVVAMGGDGVTHHVANGLVGTDTALGLIPVGTTNVLARILRLPTRPLAAAKFLGADPNTRRIPVARVEGNGPDLRIAGYALFAAGLGLDAEIVQQAESTPHRKAWFGGLHYARSAAWLFISKFRNRLPTLRDRHAAVEGWKVTFDFRGKSGIDHAVSITDRRLARIIQRCQELPGEELFQYLDEKGRRQAVDSGDINAYLADITGGNLTAKDIRTWTGTVLAAAALRDLGVADSEKTAKANILAAIDAVAERLGNTRAVCRKYYVHPKVLELYCDGHIIGASRAPKKHKRGGGRAIGLRRDEVAVLKLLELQ